MNLSPDFLIVRTDRLGDVVLTLPMARAIKKVFPNARLSFLARGYTKPILERSPDVDEIRMLESDVSFRERIRLFHGVNAAFFPSPRFELALAAFLARVPIRVGTGYRWYSFLFNRKIYEHRKTANRHEAEYNLRMLHVIGIDANLNKLPEIVLRAVDTESIDKWLKKNGISNYAVLHIGLGGSSHPWPQKNFERLGIQIAEKYGMKIILTGTPDERAKIDEAMQAIGTNRAFTFTGHTLAELAALLEGASVVIAASTGPGHLAATLSTPSIGLFPLPLPLSKERWGFRGRYVRNLSPQPLAECPSCEECTCMERIAVDSVMNAVDNLLPIVSS